MRNHVTLNESDPHLSHSLPLRHPLSEDGTQAKLYSLLRDVFKLKEFRPRQQEVCEAVLRGENVLLVMPTGAGKSLCYELPGLARPGTVLVVSPLVALIEDQVAKLTRFHLRAERIHSGQTRVDSRMVCQKYLRGELDFLFIAPERLSVPGFAEMLGKRKLSLIAVDEAHCISGWGHDFRSEYRMLGQRLLRFSDAPILALTATATEKVQQDICAQLGLDKKRQAKRFIYGFRRDNLAIEAVHLSPARRGEVVLRLLSQKKYVPAIVYTQTRQKAEEMAQVLMERKIRAGVYHAGMSPKDRERVQQAFLCGELDIMVATVAFGMGIDKADIKMVIHAGMPQNLESYYQEIGRAGRDGSLARSVLLHSYADVRTHHFLLSKAYPELKQMDQVCHALRGGPMDERSLRNKVEMDDESYERCLDQLGLHHAIVFDHHGHITLTGHDFVPSYVAQREQRFNQLESMVRYAQSIKCRMHELVQHFGDESHEKLKCGICDNCEPDGRICKVFLKSDESEKRLIQAIKDELIGKKKTMGQLFSSFEGAVSRDDFHHLIDMLLRQEDLRFEWASFEKDGRQIQFKRLWLSDEEGAKKRRTNVGSVHLDPSLQKNVKKAIKNRRPSWGAPSRNRSFINPRSPTKSHHPKIA